MTLGTTRNLLPILNAKHTEMCKDGISGQRLDFFQQVQINGRAL